MGKLKRVITILFGLAVSASFAAEPVRPSRGVATPVTAAMDSEYQNQVAPESEPTRNAENELVRPTRGYEPSVQVARSGASRSESATDSVRTRTEATGDSVVRTSTTRTKNVGLRPSVAEVGGRAVIGRTNVMTGSNIDEEVSKKLTRRTRAATGLLGGAGSDPSAAAAPAASVPSSSDELSSCSAAYFDCMDQFCNVLDANQQQCSCSSRLDQYKKVEDSLTKANEELNTVAQQIRYVGLSADEVRSILKETEAETVLSSMDDNTESRDMLEEIEKIIKSPDSSDFGSSSASSAEFELDFSASGDIDMDSMFGSNSSSFANMRGPELYNAAKKKCATILTRCAPKKTDQSIVAGQYDIEIDKACVQYEAGLQKASNGVRTNIRSATQMLQKARLAVLSDQNTYDARGCVSALDACMKDDMVCGSNYYKCIDPTKTAIDENGTVIPGGDLIKITNLLSTYNNADISDSFLDGSTVDKCATGTSATNGQCISYYLKSRIGSMDSNGRVISGFCRPVLDKCRRYSYNDNQYVANNTIIKSYMQRTLPQIKAAQNNIIAEYAGSCIHDVSDCYNSQITQVNSYSGGLSLSPSTVKPVLMGACRNVALSCAYAVFSSTADRTSGGACYTADGCINSLSNMFYQSMLCPINSTWTDTVGTPAINNKYSAGSDYVNSNCKCNNTYYVYNGTCSATATCPTNSAWYNSTVIQANGTDGGITIAYCKCTTGFKVYNGTCIQ